MNRDYEQEEKDAQRMRAKLRPVTCTRCGGHCDIVTGLSDDAHFPGTVYRICNNCGHDQPIAPGKPGYRYARDVREKEAKP